ncbi:MAG TPA: sigma-70 family RNA polymerase sigma factor [Virgibacillus sp.]|nr:sigma-70 family RNA polymerase sigma factor [Virgibacillus sp.]
MTKRTENCHDAFHMFKKEHSELFRQPIIQSFLRDERHETLLKQAICSPTQKNMQRLDKTFKVFYGKAKMLTYLSRIIYYNAINFDKTIRKHRGREMLTLDQPLQNDSEETQKELLYDPSPDIHEKIARETIADYIEEPRLFQAIQTLTTKQQKILTYKYVHNLKIKEIADIFNESPQNISKMHKNILQKLKSILKGVES